MHSKTLHKLETNHSIGDLHKAVQQAIEIEITTISLYLYTYYSINRVPKQDDIITYYTKKLMDNANGEEIRASSSTSAAKDLDLFDFDADQVAFVLQIRYHVFCRLMYKLACVCVSGG